MAIKAHLDSPESSGVPGDNPRAVPRSAQRRALRLETSGLAPDGGEANVTIHNISAAGLLLETALELATGEQFALDLPEAGIVTAVIIWRSERLFGCAFDQPIGPAALAAAQLQGLTIAPDAAPAPPSLTMPEPRSSQPLGVRLNRMRREAGLTLADVANALGVSKPTVWAWEKGKARPLPERLDAIAAVLGAVPNSLAESHASDSIAAGVIEDCRQRIATACGTQPGSVRIMIEL